MKARALVVVVGGILAACHAAAPPPVAPPPPPPPPTCDQIATHARALLQPKYGDDPAKLDHVDAIVQTHCTGDAWSPEVRACIQGTQSLDDGHHCLDKLPAAQHTALMSDLDAAVRVTPPPPPPSSMPPHCVEYRAVMDRYFACPKIPPAARDAARDAFQAAWQQWEALPVESKTALDDACKAAVEAAGVLTCPP